MELNLERDSMDSYTKYLHSKDILTGRELKDQSVPKTTENKIKHKRGSSFGVGTTHYDSKSREIPQSGFSVYYSVYLGMLSR